MADISGLKIERPALRARSAAARRLKIAAAAAALVAVVAAAFLLRPPRAVEVATVSLVYPSQSFTVLNASGYVVPQRKAAVASKTTGRLEWLGVEEGARVKAGEVLARLESKDADAARRQSAENVAATVAGLEEAKAELEDAERAFARQKELIAQGIVARAEYDAAEARLKRSRAAVSAAQATVKSARAALSGAEIANDYALIRAPFDGVVLTKNADIGDIVTPLGAAANAKAAVVTLADLSSLQVEADVSESSIGKVRPGQPCEIQLDALPEARLEGVVHTLVPTADRTKATVLVKVKFLRLDPRVLPEMSARVAFLSRPVGEQEKTPRVAVNPAAVVKRDGKNSVLVFEKERGVLREITVGPLIGEMTEVLSGLKAGEKVVVNPSPKLRSGDRVKVDQK